MRTSLRAYVCLLCLYPREFRLEFSGEMICAFEQGLNDARRARSRADVAALWLDVLREVFTVALPMQLQQAPVVASAVSLIGTSALYLALFWALTGLNRQEPRITHRTSLESMTHGR